MHSRLQLALALAALSLLALACNLTATPPAPTQEAEPTSAPSATPTQRPSPTPTPLPPGLAVVGPVETVFDWSRDRCGREDIPDLAARAFRDADGRVQLISSHLLSRRMLGPSLNELQRDCTIVMSSDHDADPAQHNDNEWIAATYSEDGETVYALLHHEYHGWEHGGDCSDLDHFRCWYNTLTMAVSRDGGASYQDIKPPPDHFVAALPDRYQEGAGPNGFFEPSNIIFHDGFYYAFIRIDETNSDEQRICLLRTADLEDPASWRAYDGGGFSVQLADPYKLAEADLGGPVPCARIDIDDLGVMNQSVTYNTFLERFVMVGNTAIHRDGRELWGVLYSTSQDLLDWSPRQLLFEAEMPWTYQPGDDVYLLYPSLLDPASESRNFASSGKTAYVYFTRFNQPGVEPLDRDLVRVPVEFFASEAQAQQAAVPFVIQP